MSNNQNEDSEGEEEHENDYALSSSDDESDMSHGDSDSEAESSDDDHDEDEAGVLAGLRHRKKIKEITREERNISLLDIDSNENEVLHMISSSRSNSVASEDGLPAAHAHDNTAVNMLAAETFLDEESGDHDKAEEVIHDEFVDMHSDDEDNDSQGFLGNNVTSNNDKESEIKEEIEHQECSVLENKKIQRIMEEISDETEEINGDEIHLGPDNKSNNNESIQEEIFPDITRDQNISSSEHGIGEVSDNTLSYDHKPDSIAAERIHSDESSDHCSTEVKVEKEVESDDSIIKDSSSVVSPTVASKVDIAEQYDTVTYEDPLSAHKVDLSLSTTQDITTSREMRDHEQRPHEITDNNEKITGTCLDEDVDKHSILQQNDSIDSDHAINPPKCIGEAVEKAVLGKVKNFNDDDIKRGILSELCSESIPDQDKDEGGQKKKEKDNNYSHGDDEKQYLKTEDQYHIKGSDLELDRYREDMATMVAEAEIMQHKLDVSEKRNAELLINITTLEQTSLLCDAQVLEDKRKLCAEIDKLKKQHAENAQALTAKHHQQVQELNKKMACLIQQAKRDEATITELREKLNDADRRFAELASHSQQESARQQEAVRFAQDKIMSEIQAEKEVCRRQQPSVETQTDPDAVLLETEEQLSALAQMNDSLKDDMNVMNYKIEELESELGSIKKQHTETSTKYENIMTTVVSHEDRANLLQFKLQAANDEVDRSNKDYQALLQQYNTSQKDIKKSNKVVHTLRAQIDELESSNEHFASRVADSIREVQFLKNENKSLKESNLQLKENYCAQTPEKNVLKSEHYSPEQQLFPDVKVLRSTVAEEPDHTAEHVLQETMFPGVHDKKYRNDDSLRDAAVTKTTKKQQASENYRKQQASASEPSLPSLVKSIVAPPTRKKNKVKKMKSKTINQFDDGSVGSNQSGSKTKAKAKICLECSCRIKGEAKVLSSELQTNLNKRRGSNNEEVEGYRAQDAEDAVFCTWVCARTWSSKHTPLQDRRTKRQLIKYIADGYNL